MITKLKNFLINHLGDLLGFIMCNLIYLSFNTPGGAQHVVLKYFTFPTFEQIAHENYFIYIVKSTFLLILLRLPGRLVSGKVTKAIVKFGKKN